MLDLLSTAADAVVAPHRVTKRRLWRARRVWSWLLLAGWIVLPLMPMIALGFSALSSR